MDTLENGTGKYERWIRLPKTGHEPNCGLSRPFIYELIRTGKVRSACIRKPGRRTGCRLVWLQSLMDYVDAHVEKAG